MTGKQLQWKAVGPWTYALDDFGTVHAPGGVGPWIAKRNGRVIGVFETREAARLAIERRAHVARRKIGG